MADPTGFICLRDTAACQPLDAIRTRSGVTLFGRFTARNLTMVPYSYPVQVFTIMCQESRWGQAPDAARVLLADAAPG